MFIPIKVKIQEKCYNKCTKTVKNRNWKKKKKWEKLTIISYSFFSFSYFLLEIIQIPNMKSSLDFSGFVLTQVTNGSRVSYSKVVAPPFTDVNLKR